MDTAIALDALDTLASLIDLIDLLETCPDHEALDLPGYNRKESSRVVWVGPQYAVKIDQQPDNLQNRREFEFYQQVPDRYRHLFPTCYWLSPCERYLIAEAVPRPNGHIGQWLAIAREWRFLGWCLRQGLDRYDLGKHDSWRFAADGQPKLVDFGAVAFTAPALE